MEKIKLILAWIDWSTFARKEEDAWETDYKFPKSLCQLAWRTLFSITMLPITWVTHIWNRIFVSMNTFRKEGTDSHKLHVWSTLGLTFVSLILGGFVYRQTDGENGTGGWGWDLFHQSDPLILTYLKLIGCGIVGAIIILILMGLLIAIIFGIAYLYGKIKSSTEESVEDSGITKIVKAVKDKYCPTIDWSSIKSKK